MSAVDIKKKALTEYHLTIPAGNVYLEVKLLNSQNIDYVVNMIKDINSCCEKNMLDKILFDSRGVKQVKNNLELYQLANLMLRDLKIPKSFRVALLINKDDRSHQFTPTVFRNAGYNIEIFFNKRKAVQWLNKLI